MSDMVIKIHHTMAEEIGFKAALEEARQGADEGGVPIGACLVDKNGKILGRGHNMRVQRGSPTIHVCNVQSLRSTPTLCETGFLTTDNTGRDSCTRKCG